MTMRHWLDLVSKEKRKETEMKAVKKFAVGMGVAAAVGVAAGILLAPKSGKETRAGLKEKALNAAESIKDTVQKKVETVKDSAAHAAQEVCSVVKDIHGKTEHKATKSAAHELQKVVD